MGLKRSPFTLKIKMPQNAIELVIMDIMMPSMDGKTAIRILKTINSEAKIIAVSGLVSDQEITAEIDGSVDGEDDDPLNFITW
jgi:two-component system, cell cycle sensor histidine kinase and response regulator CckA